jgi:predicted methyltransferase
VNFLRFLRAMNNSSRIFALLGSSTNRGEDHTGNLVRRLQRLGFDVTIAPRLAPGLPAPLEPAG